MSTVEEILRSSGIARSEASMLFAHVLGRDRVWLVSHADDDIAEPLRAKAEALFARRRAGEPVAYVLEEREFWGLALAVSPAVLIPRPETERLVELALERLPVEAESSVLDLGTGSGAIAIAIATERPRARVTAIDVSGSALAVARTNNARHGGRVRLLQSDWFAALGGERFDLIVSNPPYIAASDAHLGEGDLRFEPKSALTPGASGMEAIEKIALGARNHLVPGGALLIEHGWDQRTACIELFTRLGFSHVADHEDLAGVPRVIEGRL